jgi:CBS domain-containing protein
MNLAALMQRPVITIAADTSVRHARAVMARHGIRHVPVVAAGALIGLLTDRHVRRVEPSTVPQLAVYEQAALLDHLPVRQVMTPRLVRRAPETPAHEAAWVLWEGRADSIVVVARKLWRRRANTPHPGGQAPAQRARSSQS